MRHKIDLYLHIHTYRYSWQFPLKPRVFIFASLYIIQMSFCQQIGRMFSLRSVNAEWSHFSIIFLNNINVSILVWFLISSCILNRYQKQNYMTLQSFYMLYSISWWNAYHLHFLCFSIRTSNEIFELWIFIKIWCNYKLFLIRNYYHALGVIILIQVSIL